jgi:hypothetical protein
MGTDECFFEPTKAKPDDIVNWLRTETGKLSPIEYSAVLWRIFATRTLTSRSARPASGRSRPADGEMAFANR